MAQAVFAVSEPSPAESLKSCIALLQSVRSQLGSHPRAQGLTRPIDDRIARLNKELAVAEATQQRLDTTTTRREANAFVDRATAIVEPSTYNKNDGPSALFKSIAEVAIRMNIHRPIPLDDKFSGTTLNLLADSLPSGATNGPAPKPLSPKFLSKVKKLLGNILDDDTDYKIAFLHFGLDGKGAREKNEICQAVGLTAHKVSDKLDRIKNSISKSWEKFLALCAEETQTKITRVRNLGWISAAALAKLRNAPSAVFDFAETMKKVPIRVLDLPNTLIEKIEQQAKVKNLDALAKYFEENYFSRLGQKRGNLQIKTKFSKEELQEIYQHLEPIFWPQKRDTSVFDRLVVSPTL